MRKLLASLSVAALVGTTVAAPAVAKQDNQGDPDKPNCYGQSMSVEASHVGGLGEVFTDPGYTVRDWQEDIRAICDPPEE
jgi:hypothetical protein